MHLSSHLHGGSGNNNSDINNKNSSTYHIIPVGICVFKHPFLRHSATSSLYIKLTTRILRM